MNAQRPSLSSTLALQTALALTSVGACSDELPEIGSLQYASSEFEVWASEDLIACGGTHAYTEAWLAAFRRRVGSAGVHEPHRFYWVGAEDTDRVPCKYGPACAFIRHRTIYSPWLPLEHELVHLELGDRIGPSLLTEGAAELFGSIAGANITDVHPVEDLVGEQHVPWTGYPSAGRFSAYLFATYGSEAYLDLLDAAASGKDEKHLRAAFDRVLAVSLDDAIADYETFSPCDPPKWRVHDFECVDLPIIPWEDPQRWHHTIALDCDNDDVIGPRSDLGPSVTDATEHIWALRALEVGELAPYRFWIESTEPAAATLEPCFAGCFDLDGVEPPSPSAEVGQPSPTLLLLPGRYWVRVAHDASSTSDVTVILERVDG